MPDDLDFPSQSSGDYMARSNSYDPLDIAPKKVVKPVVAKEKKEVNKVPAYEEYDPLAIMPVVKKKENEVVKKPAPIMKKPEQNKELLGKRPNGSSKNGSAFQAASHS